MEERPSSSFSPNPNNSLRQTPSLSTPHNPIFRPRPYPSRKRSLRNQFIESETYIVQIPRDQIFSIPPPENAIIAEHHHNPEKESRCGNRRFCIVITSILLIALLLGISIGIFFLLFMSPQVPLFSISKVRTTKFGCQIRLETKNPNPRVRISYGSNGDAIAKLIYKDQRIAAGEFPELEQDAGETSNVQLDLKNAKGTSPDDVEKRIGGTKGKQRVNLLLKMNLPVKLYVGPLKVSSKVINCNCNFNVRSFGSSNDVLSQQCRTKLE